MPTRRVPPLSSRLAAKSARAAAPAPRTAPPPEPEPVLELESESELQAWVAFAAAAVSRVGTRHAANTADAMLLELRERYPLGELEPHADLSGDESPHEHGNGATTR